MKRTEKAIEADIIRALRDLGFQVSKFSQPRNTMQSPGIPDLYASHGNWRIRLWIEVKRPGGSLTDAQIAWHLAEFAAGGDVITARCVADVLNALVILGAPIEWRQPA